MLSPKIETILATLTDEEKREVVTALFPGVVRKLRKPRSIHDEDGTYLGEYIPAQPVPPPQPYSEAMRKWLSEQVCKSREEWAKEKLATH